MNDKRPDGPAIRAFSYSNGAIHVSLLAFRLSVLHAVVDGKSVMRLSSVLLPVLLATTVLTSVPAGAAPQDPAPSAQDPIRLEDVVINAGRLEQAAAAFVDEVAAPVPRRRMARWHEGVCVGVVNFDPEVGHFIADRVSDVARQVGLRAHEPECNPSIVIVGAQDASSFTRAFVDMRPVIFRPGGSGMSRGTGALEEFITTERPVRWWSVSQTTDPDTGASAVRMPGQFNGWVQGGGGSDSVMNYAPNTAVRSTSRLSDPYRDDLKRMFVIVDVNLLGGTTLQQLADYIAMISLAQINPDADTDRYETILNLFDHPEFAPGLTGWDMAYLQGLYESEWYRTNETSQIRAVAQAISREYRDAESQPEKLTGD